MPRLAVVTGASSGIGAATAARLGADGWTVVLVARNQGRLDEVAERVRAGGGTPVVEPLDAGDGDAVLAMAGRVLDRHGVPEAIVNSAGHGQWRFIEETSPQEADAMLDAPLRAAYHTTHAFMGALLEQGRGVVVHIGSPGAFVPWPGSTAYTISRWALRGLHEALCQDLAGTGVHSCHVVFGEVSSGYWDANPEAEANKPTIDRVLPVVTPEYCADVVAATIERPRAEVVAPPAVRALMSVNKVAAPLTKLLLRRTGRRH